MRENFEKYLQNKGFSKASIKSYLNNSKIFIGWMEASSLTVSELVYDDLLSFIRYCRELGYSVKSINIQLNTVRHLLAFTNAANKHIANYLFVRGEVRRLPHDLFNEKELEAMYQSYPDNYSLKISQDKRKRNKAILGLLIYQGIRREELAKLRLHHLKLEKGQLFIPESRRVNSRTVQLERHQILQLHQYIETVKPVLTGDESSFLTDKPDPILTHLRSTLRKQFPRLKIITQIRASVIANKLKTDGLRQVQYFAGHKYASSTLFYKQEDLEELKKDIEKYHPLN